jgi:hypothetical protein
MRIVTSTTTAIMSLSRSFLQLFLRCKLYSPLNFRVSDSVVLGLPNEILFQHEVLVTGLFESNSFRSLRPIRFLSFDLVLFHPIHLTHNARSLYLVVL